MWSKQLAVAPGARFLRGRVVELLRAPRAVQMECRSTWRNLIQCLPKGCPSRMREDCWSRGQKVSELLGSARVECRIIGASDLVDISVDPTLSAGNRQWRIAPMTQHRRSWKKVPDSSISSEIPPHWASGGHQVSRPGRVHWMILCTSSSSKEKRPGPAASTITAAAKYTPSSSSR